MSIEELIALLVLLYTNMEDEILRAAASHMGVDETSGADLDRWRMSHLAQAAVFEREVSRIIRSYQAPQREIAETIIMQSAAAQVSAVDAAVSAAVYAGTAAPYVVSVVRADTVSNPYRAASKAASYFRQQARHDINTVNTVMRYKAKQGFVTAVNSAYFSAKESERVWSALGEGALSVANGTESLQSAVRNCLKKMSEKGIPAFIDKAGREWSPEAYVRMDIRTTAANTARQAQFDRCDEYGISLIEVDAHAGARPLCAPYQGRIFSRDGTSGKAKDGSGREFDYVPLESTSYGRPAGLFGINCGHRPYPFSPGISFKTYSPLETEDDFKENAAKYKQFQKQRALERQIRSAKRDCMMDDAAGDKEGYEKSAAFLAKSRQKYSAYCKANHLPEHQDRTQVFGFDRSQSAKAVWAERKRTEKVTMAKSQQTAYQNAVRNTKKELLDIDAKRKTASGAELDKLNAQYNAKAAELKGHEKTLAEFSKANGLTNSAEAVKVEGFGKAQAARATRAANSGLTSGGGSGTMSTGKSVGGVKSGDALNIPQNVGKVDFSDKAAVNQALSQYQNEWKDLDYEMDCTITSDGRIWITKGDSGTVHPELIETVENGCSLKGSYSYHNHPAAETNYSLSEDDVGFFFEHRCDYSKAADDKYEYFMRRIDKTVDMGYSEAVYKFKSVYKSKVFQYTIDNDMDIDEHGYHLAMKFLSEELGFEYGRHKL